MKYLLDEGEYSELKQNYVNSEEYYKMVKALEWARDQLKQDNCGKSHCDTCKLSWIGFDRIGEEFVNKVAGKDGVPTQEISNTICPKKYSYSK